MPEPGDGTRTLRRTPEADERERSRARRATTSGVYKRKKWETIRRAVLARDPICRVCEKTLSTEVDHVVRLAEGGDPYDPAGLQGICSPCHWAKTARENATGGKAVDAAA